MSTASSKKKNSAAPALATTGRGAAVFITFGVVFFTLGLAFFLSLAADNGSYFLGKVKNSALGLADILSPFLPFLLCWGGLKLLVSARHKVAWRDILILTVFYLFLLSVFTLTARVENNGGMIAYLDHISRLEVNQDSYSEFLRNTFEEATRSDNPARGTGGLLGMVIAYPLWKLFTRIGALLFVILLLIGLLLLLFRINPSALFRRASDFKEKRRIRSAEKRRQQEWETAQMLQAEQAVPSDNYIHEEDTQPAPSAQQQNQAYTPPAFYQSAPIYQTAPSMHSQQNQDFYPVQPELYEERYPLHNHRDNKAQSAAFERRQQDIPAYPEAHTVVNKCEQEYEPVQKSERHQEPADQPAFIPDEPIPEPKEDNLYSEPEDDLPWDVPEQSISAPSVSKEAEYKEMPPVSASKKEKKTPAASVQESTVSTSWASQVRQKQAEISDFPEHTTAKGDPKPVYTDPVMPITGERIPIQPRKEMKEEAGSRLDGTAPPKVHQTSMHLPIQYQAPPMRLLNESRHVSQADATQEDERRAQIIESTLGSFGVEARVKEITHGPSITRFAIQIAPGVKVSRVTNTAENLALELKTKHVRVEAPIQGTNYIGIEVPNALVSTVSLREVLDSPEMKNNPSPLLVALGKDIAGAPVLCDLSKMPHLLIAGATGSGKSVCINSIVCSLLYRTSPDQVRLIMIDPKQVELSVYNSIPHLLVPVVSDPRKASGALAWVVQEMLERYGKFSAMNKKNLASYNKANQGTDKVLPNIVVIIDEMADLMEVCRKDVEESIRRLAALARAAGIYMVLATQRPSVDVITGVIKNNIPSRIAFAVSSGTDSRTIIDINGAEKLMGRGDMLYKPAGSSPQRVQGCLVTEDEVNAVTEYIGRRYDTNYDPNIAEHLESAGKEKPEADDYSDDEQDRSAGSDLDDYLIQAIEMAVEDGQTSTSMLQRRLRVGYARAGRLIDEMEKRGVISHSEGSKPRKTLITREQYYELFSDD